MRIAILAAMDVGDPRAWSGTPYHAREGLARQGAEIVDLGPMPAWPLRAMEMRRQIERRVGVAPTLPGASLAYSRFCGRLARARLARLPERPDVVLSPAGSPLVASLGTDLPVAYLSDATVRQMLGYYPEFTGLAPQSVRTAEALEAAAIRRAGLLVYPTRWAAESAVRDYGADPARVLVAPFGANVVDAEIDRSAGPPEDGVCRLLFVGADWERKGGAIALNVLRRLQAAGVRSQLTLVGARPPGPVDLPGAEVVGFLDKNRPEHRQRLHALYREASFFVLPTRNECYGIVLCEAAAYGLPALAARTGGVPEVIEDGVSGFVRPLDDDGAGYAARIAAIWADPARYRAFRAASRAAFETRLNWTVWARAVLAAMERLAARPLGEADTGGGIAAGVSARGPGRSRLSSGERDQPRGSDLSRRSKASLGAERHAVAADRP